MHTLTGERRKNSANLRWKHCRLLKSEGQGLTFLQPACRSTLQISRNGRHALPRYLYNLRRLNLVIRGVQKSLYWKFYSASLLFAVAVCARPLCVQVQSKLSLHVDNGPTIKRNFVLVYLLATISKRLALSQNIMKNPKRIPTKTTSALTFHVEGKLL